MLLNNYYKIMRYRACMNATKTTTMTIPDIKIADGTTQTEIRAGTNQCGFITPFPKPYAAMVSQTAKFPVTPTNTSNVYGNLIIGSGTTPVTASDYMMEQEIVDMTYISMYCSFDVTTGDISIVKTMRNETEETISVSEIGFTEPYWNQSSSTPLQILTFREVYDTPVLVSPGETFSVTLNIQNT